MTREVKVIANIMRANDSLAEENRSLLRERGIYGVNIMASPGAGKTSVILRAISGLKASMPIMVVEGDVASSIDADKIATTSTPVIQINTGGGCHLNADMVRQALDTLELHDGGLLFIENVGNLICPANWDLGQELRLVIASVTEGHDKPFKYPGIFANADAVVLNKTDLISYFEFDLVQFIEGVHAVNPSVPVFPLSCRDGEGVSAWLTWLKDRAAALKYSDASSISRERCRE